MRHPLPFAAVLIALVTAVGCQSKTESASPAPAATSSETAPKASAAPPAAGGEIGVAACDEYLDKWETCLATKVTGDAREQVKVALDASRDGWKRAAATPEGKAGLAAACQQAVELAKMQVAAYGCTW
jgi:hypothetical protein